MNFETNTVKGSKYFFPNENTCFPKKINDKKIIIISKNGW